MAHELELCFHSLIGQCLYIRYPAIDHIQSEQSQYHRHQERNSPGHRMTEKCTERNTHQVGERHSGAHHCHCLGFLAFLGHFHSHDCCRSEVSTMWQALDKAGAEQQPVVRGNSGNNGSYHHQRRKKKQDILRAILVHQYQGEGSCTNAQGINGDEMTHLRDAHIHVVCHICENSLDNKFRHSEGESTQGECKQSFFHYSLCIILLYQINLIFSGCKITKRK